MAVPNAWVRRFGPGLDGVPRLVCFPHAGGSASFFFPAAKALSGEAEVLAIQYPGRQDRRNEPCVDSIDELADRVYAELVPWTGRPLTLFGHSMGATLAFEVARRLQADGRPPSGLFASGRRAPSAHRDESLHQADDARILATLKEMSGTDQQVLDDDELIRSILPAVRADYRAAETYRYAPGEPLDCPVFVLTGDADDEVTLDEARAWSAHTSAQYTLRVFEGGHFFLIAHAAAVTAALSEHLGSLSALAVKGAAG